jgi:CRP/FNR family nitrogen fixation transcriptional regulator
MLIDTQFRLDGHSHGPEATAGLLSGAQLSATTFHPENSVIYAQGDQAGPLYIVEFGVVRICRVTADGRRQISAFHFPGEVFGFDAAGEHQFSAESVNGAGVRTLRASTNNDVTRNILALALSSLVRAQQHQLVLGRHSAAEKVAGFIVDMIERTDADDVIGLPMQRNDVADYLGLTFETVSRALRALKDDGIIQVPSTSQIAILDRPALEEMAA